MKLCPITQSWSQYKWAWCKEAQELVLSAVLYLENSIVQQLEIVKEANVQKLQNKIKLDEASQSNTTKLKTNKKYRKCLEPHAILDMVTNEIVWQNEALNSQLSPFMVLDKKYTTAQWCIYNNFSLDKHRHQIWDKFLFQF